MKTSIITAALVLLTFNAMPADLIVESRSSGQNVSMYKEVAGAWTDSGSSSTTEKSRAPGLSAPEKCGTRKTRLSGEKAASRWQPDITEAGQYFVYVTWPQAANAAKATYVVKHADGEAVKRLDQNGGGNTGKSNADQWVELGRFNFKPALVQYVELRVDAETVPFDRTGLANAYADAARFSTKAVQLTSHEPLKNIVKETSATQGRTTSSPPEKLVIECRPEGQNYANTKEISGRWIESAGKSNAPLLTAAPKCGSKKTTIGPYAAGPVPGEIRFYPKLDQPARYFVYVTWPKEGNANPVTLIVKYSKGSETKKVIQDGWGATTQGSNGNSWVSLGEYDFTARDDQYVAVVSTGSDITLPHPKNPGQLFADAVLFSLKPVDTKQGQTLATTSSPVGTPASQPTGKISWLTDLDLGRKRASDQGKKLLLFFYSPESTTSAHYENVVFKDASVVQVANSGYVCVRLNHAENRELANQLQIFKAGTIMLFDSNGNGINVVTGKISPTELANSLR